MTIMLSDAPISAVLPAEDIKRAEKFYKEKLGLKVQHVEEGLLILEGGKSTTLTIYERGKSRADHTQASFLVEKIYDVVKELKEKGVEFEEYDMGLIKTVDCVATIGNKKSAWFKDTEGNTLSINQV